jgi:hypothetical protein
MTLQQWVDNDWLKLHTTSIQEIANLLAIVDRDLKDAAEEISADWRFSIAYNAVLNLCRIVLYASGYRPAKGGLEHYRPIQALPLILGESYRPDTVFLDACRKKRHMLEYDLTGVATQDDVRELVAFARDLRAKVLEWLRGHHPDLLKSEESQ